MTMEKHGVQDAAEQQRAELENVKARRRALEQAKPLDKKAADEAGHARQFDKEDRELANLALREQELEDALKPGSGQ